MIAPGMLLALDVGNTQTHFGTFRDGELVEHWRFATVRTSTADELGAALANLLELRGAAFADLDASIISTVVPELEPEYEAMAERYLRHKILMVGPGLKTGMAIRIDNPRELGADRLVNSIAASSASTPRASSSTSAPHQLRRGLGRGRVPRRNHRPRRGDLARRAAPARGQLVRVDLDEPRGVIGKSTIDSVRSGVVYGFAGQVDGIVERVRAELGEGTKRHRHRRPGRVIVPYCESIDEVDDLLTLTGLRLIYGRSDVGRSLEHGRPGLCPEPPADAAGGVAIPNRVALAPLAGIGNWFVRLQARPPRRRAGRLRDGLELRRPPPQRAHLARAAAHPPRRAPGLACSSSAPTPRSWLGGREGGRAPAPT